MNEEELKKEILKKVDDKFWSLKDCQIITEGEADTEVEVDEDFYPERALRYGIVLGFQKGKLEQKKEELKFLKERCIYCMIADERIKQLQKEIREEKQDENS